MMPCTAFTTRHSLCCSLYTLHIQMLCHMLVWAKVRKVILDEIVNAQIFSNILVYKTLLAKKKLLVDIHIKSKMFRRSYNIGESRYLQIKAV
jgi:hypothetical protein